MAKRRLCNYANASNEIARDGAIYQRGQYYIVENNNRRGDRRRYAAYLNDDLIGFGGSLVRVKRFINDMYKDYPFETEVNEGLEKVKRFARRAQMTLRTELKPSRTDTGRKSGRRSSPGAARKKSAGKNAAVRAGTKPILDVTAGKVVQRGKLNKKQADELQRFIESETDRNDLVRTMQRLDTQYENNNHFRRLFKVAQARLKELQTPQQGRLF